MKSGRKLRIIIISCTLVMSGLTAMFLIKPILTNLSVAYSNAAGSKAAFSNSPLDKFDFTNCKINLSRFNGENVYLSDKQKKEFIEILWQADINKYGISEIPGYVGGYDIYEMEFENGESTMVYRVKDPYLVIGEKAYKCYSEESLNLLDELTKEIYKEQ